MNYDQTHYLFDVMDDLEMYSKMQRNEELSDNADWDSVQRYRDNIQLARKTLFDLVQGKQND